MYTRFNHCIRSTYSESTPVSQSHQHQPCTHSGGREVGKTEGEGNVEWGGRENGITDKQLAIEGRGGEGKQSMARKRKRINMCRLSNLQKLH